jgi:hypothetical protein
MDWDLHKLENPTLQLKLQKLMSNPWNGYLRRAATSSEAIARLRATPSDELMTLQAGHATGVSFDGDARAVANLR